MDAHTDRAKNGIQFSFCAGTKGKFGGTDEKRSITDFKVMVNNNATAVNPKIICYWLWTFSAPLQQVIFHLEKHQSKHGISYVGWIDDQLTTIRYETTPRMHILKNTHILYPSIEASSSAIWRMIVFDNEKRGRSRISPVFSETKRNIFVVLNFSWNFEESLKLIACHESCCLMIRQILNALSRSYEDSLTRMYVYVRRVICELRLEWVVAICIERYCALSPNRWGLYELISILTGTSWSCIPSGSFSLARQGSFDFNKHL